jgi:membrane-associated phospholipid phosphatase
LNEKLLQKFARLISIIFIPPVLTVISFFYLALKFESDSIKSSYTIIIAVLFGFILQIASFIYFRKKGLLSDVDAKIKNERTLPFLVSLLIYILGFILLLLLKVNIISIAFWFCYISNTFLVILINKYLKISIHAMGVSGPLALFTFIIGIEALVLLPILLAVGWSRIKLKCHSFTEVIAGSLVGFISVYIQLSVFLK